MKYTISVCELVVPYRVYLYGHYLICLDIVMDVFECNTQYRHWF